MSFAYPFLLALIVGIIPMLWLASRRRKTVGHSQVGLHRNVKSMPIFGWIPTVLLALTWVVLCVAISGPRLTEVTEKQTIQARDFVVVVDVSGSMSATLSDPAQQTFAGPTGGTNPSDPAARPPTRANAARQGVKLFVERRNGDRLALLLFDDDCYYVWPFTTDMTLIQKKLPLIDQYNGGGTNFGGPDPDRPWSKTGGIQGAINHFKELAASKTKVLIMVTDGEDSINPRRFDELTAQMKALGIKIYVLGVGEGWVSGGQNDLRRFVEGLGGKVIPVGDAQQMRDGFETIDRLEKSTVEIDRIQGFREIYQYFLFAALALALLYKTSSAFVREDD